MDLRKKEKRCRTWPLFCDTSRETRRRKDSAHVSARSAARGLGGARLSLLALLPSSRESRTCPPVGAAVGLTLREDVLLCPRLRDFARGKGRGALLLIPSGTANAMRKDRSCSVRVDCDVAVSTATDFFLFFSPSCSAAKCGNDEKIRS